MATRYMAWLAPVTLSVTLSITLSAQYGRPAAPARCAPAAAAPRAAPPVARTPSAPAVGRGQAKAIAPSTICPSAGRLAPGTPSQAVSPLEDPAAAAPLADGSVPPRPASPTLDTVAADPAEKARALAGAREFRAMKLSAGKVSRAVRKLAGLRWHKSLPQAAAAAKAEHKPILWIQALGDLRGYT